MQSTISKIIINQLKIPVLLITLLFGPCSLSAQSVPYDSLHTLYKSVQQPKELNVKPSVEHRSPLGRLGRDLLAQFTSIFDINSDNALWLASGTFITGAMLASDQGTYNTLRRFKRNNKWLNEISPVISEFGSNYGLGVVAANTLYGLIFGNSKALETSYLATESIICSGIWSRAVKMITGRERPSARNQFSNKSGGVWRGPLGFFGKKKGGRSVSSYDAFPSGHTATAFSIATVFACQYSETPVVPILSYTCATLVGISRIIEDTHWASDVFVGAILGYLTSKQIMLNNPSELSRSREQSITHKTEKSRSHFAYSLDPFSQSVVISYKF